MFRAVLVAFAALAGCFTAPVAQAPRPVVIWPDVSHARPLAVGQWALYRERDAEGSAYARFEVVSTGTCGTWVRVALYGRGDGRLWLLCVQPSGHVETAIVDAKPVDPAHPGDEAAELSALSTRIAPPQLDATAASEDVATEAGTFERALRTRAAGATAWIHPAVPFAGIVRIAAGPLREDTLVAYGDHPPAPARRIERPLRFVEFGAGLGWISNTQPGDPSRTSDLHYGIGLRVAPWLDAVFNISGGRTNDDNDYLASSKLFIGGGARLRALDSHLYVRLGGGFSRVHTRTGPLVTDSVSANGFGVAASIGYPVFRARDWQFSLEAGGVASVLGDDIGFRQTLDIAGVIELRLP